jgi:HTH-type transcriptional regulator / antitoxin HigA
MYCQPVCCAALTGRQQREYTSVVTAIAPDPQPNHPGLILRRLLAERGWTVTELSAITGYGRPALSAVLNLKTGVSPDLAIALGAAFGNSAAEWLQWNADHQLSLVEVDAAAVARRARLFSEAPIHEMQKRGWIPDTKNVDEIERAIDKFFTGDVFSIATLRRDSTAALTPEERAWCYQARRLAAGLPFVAEFDKSRLPAAEKKLRQLAAYEKEAERVAEMLSYFGIRFVVVEPLRGAKIDGAAFWIGEYPVIAVSLRWDRIDAFWFTLFHEFMHIKNGDVYSVDVNLVEEGDNGLTVATASGEAERRANEGAAASLVPPTALKTFIATTSPRYSATAVIQFAHQIKMHPGVIVGQLQHRGEVSYGAHRSFLVKVRKLVTESAVTDGWGQAPLPA